MSAAHMRKVVRAPKRDRRTERTVDLKEPEIAAIEAAEMTPEEDPSHVPPEVPTNT